MRTTAVSQPLPFPPRSSEEKKFGEVCRLWWSSPRPDGQPYRTLSPPKYARLVTRLGPQPPTHTPEICTAPSTITHITQSIRDTTRLGAAQYAAHKPTVDFYFCRAEGRPEAVV